MPACRHAPCNTTPLQTFSSIEAGLQSASSATRANTGVANTAAACCASTAPRWRLRGRIRLWQPAAVQMCPHALLPARCAPQLAACVLFCECCKWWHVHMSGECLQAVKSIKATHAAADPSTHLVCCMNGRMLWHLRMRVAVTVPAKKPLVQPRDSMRAQKLITAAGLWLACRPSDRDAASTKIPLRSHLPIHVMVLFPAGRRVWQPKETISAQKTHQDIRSAAGMLARCPAQLVACRAPLISTPEHACHCEFLSTIASSRSQRTHFCPETHHDICFFCSWQAAPVHAQQVRIETPP